MLNPLTSRPSLQPPGPHVRQTHILPLLLLAALLVTACGRERESAVVESAGEAPAAAEQQAQPDAPAAAGVRADGTFRIVATTTQASDLSRILTDGVAGIEITPLMGAGVDPPSLPAHRVRYTRHERRRHGHLQRAAPGRAVRCRLRSPARAGHPDLQPFQTGQGRRLRHRRLRRRPDPGRYRRPALLVRPPQLGDYNRRPGPDVCRARSGQCRHLHRPRRRLQ